MKHIHWEFVGYDEADNGNQLKFPTEIVVVGSETEDHALLQAKMMIKRKNYWLRKSWQCTTCENQEKQIKSMEEMVKFMKGENR